MLCLPNSGASVLGTTLLTTSDGKSSSQPAGPRLYQEPEADIPEGIEELAVRSRGMLVQASPHWYGCHEELWCVGSCYGLRLSLLQVGQEDRTFSGAAEGEAQDKELLFG